MKPKKQCNHAGCKQLVPFNVAYCSAHKPKPRVKPSDTYTVRKAKGGKYYDFYHSRKWRKLSEVYRIKNPCCEECLLDGIIKKADVVDHIEEIRDNWERRYDEANLRSLCHYHHNLKTRRVQQARKGG